MKATNLTRQQSLAISRGLVAPTAARSFSWIEDMTNDTGADIVEGSVVVVLADGTIELADTLNDPRPTGVALDTIDDGETGQVCFGGPVDLVLVTASVTAGQYGQTSTTPGQAQVTTGPATAFCMFTTSGTEPEAFLWGGRGGGGIAVGLSTLPWFNVRDFGAVGDGTTDDLTAFNDAIADLNAAGTGVLYIPASPDAYVISGALTTISVPATIMGDGWMTGASGPTSRISFTSTTATLFTVSVNGCLFRDLAMLQTGGTATAGSAITTTGGILADFNHLIFDGFWISIDIENSSVWNVRRCYFGTIRKYGIKVRNTAAPDSGDWTITESVFSGSVPGDAAIRIESSGGGRIINNKVNGNVSGANRFNYGIDMAIGTGASSIILIVEGNSLEGMGADGIRIVTSGSGSYSQALIVGNQVSLYGNNSDRAVNLSSTNLTKVVVTDNVFNTNGTARAAVAVTNSTGVRIGPNTLVGFNAEFTNSGGTIIDDTGAIAAGVAIVGTPSVGDVPIASSGTAAAWGAPSAGFIDPMTTRGDVIYRNASNVTARLGIGSAGKVPLSDGTDLAYGFATGSKWTRGTSMPGSPASGERITRTDLGVTFEYDGTRWLCICPHFTQFGVGNTTAPDATGTAWGRIAPPSGLDLWIIAWEVGTYIATTNNGTNYWTVSFDEYDSADTPTNLDSFNTSADSANGWVRRRRTIGAAYAQSSFVGMRVTGGKTLAPGPAYFEGPGIEFFLIGT